MRTAPVVYIFFNRPQMVRQTFPAIRAQRPARLHLIADGPRAHVATDASRCAETRAAVEAMIDWDCEVVRDYAAANLGAQRRITTGLTAAFARLGEAIVLEDDIAPHPDFFAFCTEQLNLHRDNPTVHGVSGFNPVGEFLPGRTRAIPTLTHLTWGWASWQRAWRGYRANLEGWAEPQQQAAIRAYLGNDLYHGAMVEAYRQVAAREVDAWDYQWVYTMHAERRYATVASVNLCRNLGFISDSTHTRTAPGYVSGLVTRGLPAAPLPAPDAGPDRLFDRVAWQVMLDGSRLKIALLRQLARRSRRLTAFVMKHPR